MKGLTHSRPSKASLVARGLAAKPFKGKRNVKSKKVPDGKAGYSLYSTDSEDQASSVGQGLDRCAALLTNILDGDSKDPRKKKAPESKQVIKARGRSASTPSTRSVLVKPPGSKAVVIPTASQKDQGPSTIYNDRLVASTPLLNSEERKRQQHLLEREQELTLQIQKLRQHFELLQQQKSPQVQEQQKRNLQDSMFHELEEYQQQESISVRQQIPSKNVAPELSVSQDEISTNLESKGTPGARRSLDFNHSHERVKEKARTENLIEAKENTHNVDYSLSSVSPSRTRSGSLVRTKKQVRVVSPDLDEQDKPSSRSQNRTVSFSESISPNEDVLSVPSKSRMSCSPIAAEDQVRTLQYLTRELRELIATSDDVEVNRLLLEIEQVCSLLPYMYTPGNSSSGSGGREHPVLHQLRQENAQLKRKLQCAEGKRLKQEELKKIYENMQKGQTSISFELAACRSENASLQKKLQEEKESKEKLKMEIEILEKTLADLKEDKKRFIEILDNKEQEHSKRRRSGQQEILRLSNDIKRLKAEIESGKLSLEAAKKESIIMNLSLKQKDTEIERLNELTRSLQQSMQRCVLVGTETYQPSSLLKDDLVSQSEKVQHSTELDPLKPILTSTRSRDRQGLPSGIHITTKQRNINASATLEHPPASLNLDPQISNDLPFSARRSFEGFHKKSPLLFSGEDQHITPEGRKANQIPLMSPDGPPYFSPKASLGPGPWTAGDFAYPSPEYKNKSVELSSLSSRDEEEFQRDLESLDAEIARVQKSLRETAKRTSII